MYKTWIARLITAVLVVFGIGMPYMVHSKQTMSNNHHIAIHKPNKEIHNDKLIIGFNDQNHIYSIYDIQNECELLNNGEEIIIPNISTYRWKNGVTSGVVQYKNDSVRLFRSNDHDNYGDQDMIEIDVKDRNIHITSNKEDTIIIKTLKDTNNNSSIKTKFINGQHIQQHKLKDGSFFSMFFGGNSGAFTAEEINNNLISSNENKLVINKDSEISIFSNNDYINRETMRSVVSVNVNHDFARAINVFGKDNYNYMAIKSSKPLHESKITIVPNRADVLREYNLYNIRSSLLPIFPDKFSQLIDKCMTLFNNKIYGFLVYIILMSMIVTPSMIYELKSINNKKNSEREMGMVDGDMGLSDAGKDAEKKRIQEKYESKGNILQSLLTFVPIIVSISNMFTAIPYCHDLLKVNVLWLNLGSIDTFNLLPVSFGYQLSPLTFIMFVLVLYKTINNYMTNKNKENIMQDALLMLSVFVITRQFSVANVIIYIWLTYIYKDLIHILYDKFGVNRSINTI